MRNKYMSDEEAKPILQHSGLPVELTSDCIPSYLRNIPSARFYASGINNTGQSWIGIEAYRDASNHPEASSGFVLNQDLYSGFYGTSGYVITGPFYDMNHHWTAAIPQHLSNTPVIDTENITE